MGKKLITACLGLFALAAFALPATASAVNNPIITHPTGTALAVGTKFLATNIGNTQLKNGEGTTTLTECTTAKMTGTVVENTTGHVTANITTATFSGTGTSFAGMNECTGVSILPNLTVTTNGTDPAGTFLEGTEDVENGTAYCLKADNTMAEHEFQLRGGTCADAARKIAFIFDTTFSGNPQCKYERSAASPIKGTFTTDTTGDAVLSVSAATPSNTKFTGATGNSILCPTSLTTQMSFTFEADEATASPFYISE
jgi:hypothetical protein